MNFDQLVADVLALASQRNVSAIIGPASSVIVSESDDFIEDLTFSVVSDPIRPVWVAYSGIGEGFATVREAFEHFDIG